MADDLVFDLFTKEEIDNLKRLVKDGKILEMQKIILDKLNEREKKKIEEQNG